MPLVYGGLHRALSLVVPAAERYSGVEVVGADEHRYRVYAVAVLGLQPLGLPRYVVPLAAAYPVDVRRKAEPLLHVAPVFLRHVAAVIIRVGHRVAEEGHPLALPRMRCGARLRAACRSVGRRRWPAPLPALCRAGL